MTDDVLPASVLLLLDERARQVVEEGYDTEHDQEHGLGELAAAASCYAAPEAYRSYPANQWGERTGDAPATWPWPDEFWKPTPDDRVTELVKAGALILAELDRIILEQKESDDA